MNRYYGQHGEDYILWQVFKDKKSGFFIDVGAFDGIHLSNSYLFELAGWQGPCIEAYPEYFALCQQNRPGSICIHAACLDDKGRETVTFYAERLGFLSSVEGDYEDVARRYQGRGLEFDGFQKIKVPAMTLDRILVSLQAQPKIDFVSIDVEGSELKVLQGFDLERYRP